MVYRYVILALSAVVLSGCGVSQTSYARSREALRGSSSLRNDFVTTCTRNISRKPLRTRQGIAKLMNISVRNTPRNSVLKSPTLNLRVAKTNGPSTG